MLTWQAHEGPVVSLAYAPDGSLLSAAADGYVKCWEPPAYQERWRYRWWFRAGEQVMNEILRAAEVVAIATMAVVSRPFLGITLLDLECGDDLSLINFQGLQAVAPGSSAETFFALGQRDQQGSHVWELSVTNVPMATSSPLGVSRSPRMSATSRLTALQRN